MKSLVLCVTLSITLLATTQAVKAKDAGSAPFTGASCGQPSGSDPFGGNPTGGPSGDDPTGGGDPTGGDPSGSGPSLSVTTEITAPGNNAPYWYGRLSPSSQGFATYPVTRSSKHTITFQNDSTPRTVTIQASGGIWDPQKLVFVAPTWSPGLPQGQGVAVAAGAKLPFTGTASCVKNEGGVGPNGLSITGTGASTVFYYSPTFLATTSATATWSGGSASQTYSPNNYPPVAGTVAYGSYTVFLLMNQVGSGAGSGPQ